MLLLLLGAGAALFCLLDAWYLLRLPLAVLHAKWLQPRLRDVLQEQSWPGLVLPSDLDWLLHMNNSRYLREADLARCAHLARCGIFDALRALGGSMVLAASCARHRRSLRLFERFAVRTRLLGWDSRAFYLEQRFVSPRQGFVCALLLCRLHVVGSSPGRLVQHLCQKQGLVLLSNLDITLRMKHARHLHKANIDSFVSRCRMFQPLSPLQSSTMLGASCSLPHHPMLLLKHFAVCTHLLDWDAHACSLEQHFVSAHHGFVCVVLFARTM